jgi:hypothetical protein
MIQGKDKNHANLNLWRRNCIESADSGAGFMDCIGAMEKW